MVLPRILSAYGLLRNSEVTESKFGDKYTGFDINYEIFAVVQASVVWYVVLYVVYVVVLVEGTHPRLYGRAERHAKIGEDGLRKPQQQTG